MKNYIYTSIALLILCVSLFPYRTFSDGGNGSLLGNGLVGYWPSDSADYANSTHIVDRSGNGNTGTLVGSPTKVNGQIGQALKFNGTTGLVDIPYNTSWPWASTTGSFTITEWINTSINTNERSFNEYDNTNFAGLIVSFNRTTAGDSQIVLEDTFQNQCGATSNGSITENKWYLIAWTVLRNNVTGIKSYINGNYEGSFDDTGCGNNSLIGALNPDVGIGQIPNQGLTTNGFTGEIDDVRVYNRVLSAGEINLLYQQGNGSYTGSFLSEMIEEINSIF